MKNKTNIINHKLRCVWFCSILAIFCFVQIQLKAQENTTIQSTLTLITTDNIGTVKNEGFKWRDSSINTNSVARFSIWPFRKKDECPKSNPCGRMPGEKTAIGNLLAAIGNFFSSIFSGKGPDIDETSTTLNPATSDDPPPTSGSPTGPPSDLHLGPSDNNGNNFTTPSETGGGYGGGSNNGSGSNNNSPSGNPNDPQTGLQDDDTKPILLNCVETFTIKLIEDSDTCISGKILKTYLVTRDCSDKPTIQLLSQECVECNSSISGSTLSQKILNAKNLISNDPYSLLKIKPDELKEWNMPLFEKPTNIQLDYIDSLRLNAGASQIKSSHIQKLKNQKDPNSHIVYLDNFVVQISKMPILNNKQLSEKELLDYIRINLNNFTDTNFIKFEPFNQNNKLRFTSQQFKVNKKGVLLKLITPNNIGYALASNCIERNNNTSNNSLLITNIIDPSMNGKRNFQTTVQYGYLLNTNNTISFYCKTAAKSSSESNLLEKIVNDTSIEFDEQIGNSFQEKLVNFIQQNNGIASFENFTNKRINEENINYLIRNNKNNCEFANDIFDTPKDTTIKKPCPNDSNFSSFKITEDFLKQINPNGTKGARDSAARFINSYRDHPTVPFKINTRLRLAHFLAQVMHETDGLRIREESSNQTDYPRKKLLKMKCFNFDSTIVDSVLGTPKIFNYIYGNSYKNGPPITGDGANYRGHGLLQLTHKDSYERFNSFYKQYFLTSYPIITPSMISDNMFYSVISALWEATIDKKANKHADNDDVLSYSKSINGYNKKTGLPNGLPSRKKYLNKIKQLLCL